MKMTLHAIDDEIREVETRIALERVALEDAITGCTNSLRNTVTSPATLLALTGVGFAVGKVLFGRKPEAPAPVAPEKAGALGFLTGVAGTALSLMRPGSGVGVLARWAAKRAFSRRKAGAGAPATASRPKKPATTIPSR